LSLDRDIQCRYRFVGDQQPWPHGERACNADALALAAGEFVRIAVHLAGRQPDPL
jgi:hypothetical protein